jgi:hypothetical protein
MLEGFKATKAERAAIESGFFAFVALAGHSYEPDNWARQEARGYGVRNQKIPLLAARGLLLKWFAHGFDNPFALLRFTYRLRPAAIYAEGFGAEINAKGRDPNGDSIAKIRAGAAAYEAAWARMYEKDKAAFDEAMKAHKAAAEND